jgi:hypothetical protein
MKDLGGGNEAMTATTLFQKFKNGSTVAQLTITDWAKEANALAKTKVYDALHIPDRTAQEGQCAPNIPKVSVTQQYVNANVDDVGKHS